MKEYIMKLKAMLRKLSLINSEELLIEQNKQKYSYLLILYLVHS